MSNSRYFPCSDSLFFWSKYWPCQQERGQAISWPFHRLHDVPLDIILILHSCRNNVLLLTTGGKGFFSETTYSDWLHCSLNLLLSCGGRATIAFVTSCHTPQALVPTSFNQSFLSQRKPIFMPTFASNPGISRRFTWWILLRWSHLSMSPYWKQATYVACVIYR